MRDYASVKSMGIGFTESAQTRRAPVQRMSMNGMNMYGGTFMQGFEILPPVPAEQARHKAVIALFGAQYEEDCAAAEKTAKEFTALLKDEKGMEAFLAGHPAADWLNALMLSDDTLNALAGAIQQADGGTKAVLHAHFAAQRERLVKFREIMDTLYERTEA